MIDSRNTRAVSFEAPCCRPTNRTGVSPIEQPA